MHELTDQYLAYIEDEFYVRERRKYKKRSRGPRKRKVYRPNTTTLKPKKSDEIYGPRTGFLDRIQGIHGYFWGGGWVFGKTENSMFRVTHESFGRYQDLKASGETSIIVNYRAGSPMGDQAGTFDLDQPGAKLPEDIPVGTFLLASKSYSVGSKRNDLPFYEDLTPIDQWAVTHDKILRQRDENIWDGVRTEDSEEAQEAFEQANLALKVRIDAIDWAVRKRWLSEDRSAFSSKVAYQRVMSMLAYQKCIANFSAFMLSFVSSDPVRIDEEFIADPIEGVTGQLRIPRTGDPSYDDWKAVRKSVEFEFTAPET